MALERLTLSTSFAVVVAVITVAACPSVYGKAAPSIEARTGALLTAVTPIFRVTVLLFKAPSLTIKLTVLDNVEGLLLGF